MTENEAINLHIGENLHRISIIEEFLRTNSNADDKVCKKNISILTKINGALQEIQEYREIGTVEEFREAMVKSNNTEQCISRLVQRGYTVKKITESMRKDANECLTLEEKGVDKECYGCSCCVCLIQ